MGAITLLIIFSPNPAAFSSSIQSIFRDVFEIFSKSSMKNRFFSLLSTRGGGSECVLGRLGRLGKFICSFVEPSFHTRITPQRNTIYNFVEILKSICLTKK